MGERRRYRVSLMFNGRKVTEVIIDPHYEAKHSEMSDPLILTLVKQLDGRYHQLDERVEDWEFFMLDKMEHEEKLYRLVWCVQDDQPFIGVINCFRR